MPVARIRTCDLRFTRALLYHWSYTGEVRWEGTPRRSTFPSLIIPIKPVEDVLVCAEGFEPSTLAPQKRRSGHTELRTDIIGCRNRYRTYIHRTKTCCPTVRRFGSKCQEVWRKEGESNPTKAPSRRLARFSRPAPSPIGLSFRNADGGREPPPDCPRPS